MVLDFRYPFVVYVRVGAWTDDTITNKKDVGLRVRQGSQTIVVLLPRCVPETQAYCYVVDHYCRCVIIETRKKNHSINKVVGFKTKGVGNTSSQFLSYRLKYFIISNY